VPFRWCLSSLPGPPGADTPGSWLRASHFRGGAPQPLGRPWQRVMLPAAQCPTRRFSALTIQVLPSSSQPIIGTSKRFNSASTL
jgi:hypothetical protein